MQKELISEGLTLMLAGMGTVFLFLTVLVIMMTLMSRLILRLQSAPGVPAPDGPSAEEIAAITAAVAQHRRK
jgi:oxaloacetate decarboxylase gamma subunit